MAIREKQLPEPGVIVTVLSGTVTPEDVLAHYDRLPSVERRRMLIYVEPTADLARINVGVIPELKRAIAAKLVELYGNERVLTAWVCGPGANEPLIDFWCRYVVGGEYLSTSVLFPTLEAACDWLGLSGAARGAAAEAIEVLG